MKKNTGFFMSFKYALCGIGAVFKNERNMRFHFVIGNLIFVFAAFYGLTQLEWAVLLLTVCSVFAAEIINTAVENAVDTATKEYSRLAKTAKDASAGAVLVTAIFSLLIGFCLFYDPVHIAETLKMIFLNPKYLIPCLILGAADILFLFFGGEKKKKDSKK